MDRYCAIKALSFVFYASNRTMGWMWFKIARASCLPLLYTYPFIELKVFVLFVVLYLSQRIQVDFLNFVLYDEQMH